MWFHCCSRRQGIRKERNRGGTAVKMVELEIKENEAGQRLDKFLHKYMKAAGSSFLYKMLRKKNITLNGKKAGGSERLCVGDEVKLFLSDETIEKFGGYLPGRPGMDMRGEDIEPVALHMGNGMKFQGQGRETDGESSGQEPGSGTGKGVPGQYGLVGGCKSAGRTRAEQYKKAYRQFGKLEVVFESHHVLIVNKPPGILTQKAGAEDISLNEWLAGYLLEKGEITEDSLHTFRPSVCNRLDRNTSGMVICGKTLPGSQMMSGLLRDRRLRKFYRMYVKGQVGEAFRAEGYLIKDEQANRVKLVGEARENARGEAGRAAYIRTEFRPLQVYKDITLMEAELITGKTHQIRLHLAGTGHPVLGDYKYGERNFNDKYKKKYGVGSQLLHACRLEFPFLEGEFGDLSEAVLTAGEPGIFAKIAEGEK